MSALAGNIYSPADLAKRLGVSERALRHKARSIGACRVLGKSMFLTEGDAEALIEAMRACPSSSTVEAKSGTIAAPLPDGDYEALQALRTRKLRRGSPPAKRIGSGKVISMDRLRS